MKRWTLVIFLAGLLSLSACSGGAKGPSSSTAPDASTTPAATTDAAGQETGADNGGTTEENSPEIVMHVIKTVLD